MNKKKIVFVLNAIVTRCIKRVEEFIANGYDVDVYAFNRGGEPYVQPKNFQITIIGEHNLTMGILRRSFVIGKSLHTLFKKYKKEDIVYYFFFFDVASIGHLFCKKPYIYEESDMPYTTRGVKSVRRVMAKIDKRVITHSLLTTMTSEGFIDFHYGNHRPENIIVVPNRVNERLLSVTYSETELNINHLRFSFVGGFRYGSTLNFFRVAAEHFPNHSFSVYGNIIRFKEEIEELARKYKNIYLKGRFKNPEDLPLIYSQTDIVLANYDAHSINAQYAEPNKLYESIFFHTPILVSSNTFLAKKVTKLGIGYNIDSYNNDEIISFIRNITEEDIIIKQNKAKMMPKSVSVNKNPELFQYLRNHGVG